MFCSYTFGFKGSAISVDTACSSSLVASHLAAGAIFGGAASAGLAAGAGLLLSPDTTAMFQKSGMLAADGRCKTLDASADGYVRGESVGVLLLQAVDGSGGSMHQAALAMFRGSAVNQDGRSSSLTAPNGPSQQEVMRQALGSASLAAADVSQLQMHGTGTPLGDPIEVGAASAVLVKGQSARQLPLAAFTSKAWIGHTEAAAGVMGLTHASVALSGRQAHGKLSSFGC
jgi:acyl transferase domain-containing protein